MFDMISIDKLLIIILKIRTDIGFHWLLLQLNNDFRMKLANSLIAPTKNERLDFERLLSIKRSIKMYNYIVQY